MNPFDIVVIVLIVLSGLFAFARGFVNPLDDFETGFGDNPLVYGQLLQA